MSFIDEKEAYPCSHCGKGEYFTREDLREVDRRAREEERERIFKKLWEREDIHPASLIQSLYPEKLEDLTPNP